MMKRKTNVLAFLLLIAVFALSGCSSTGERHTLSIAIQGEGDVTPASGTEHLPGTMVSLTATPKEGWVFDHWESSKDSKVVDHKILMQGDEKVTAVFIQTEIDTCQVAGNLSGTLNLPGLANGNFYTIHIDTDTDLMNGSAYTIEDYHLSYSLSIDYSLDVAPGSYYVYAMVDKNNSFFVQGPVAGDYMGFYGSMGPVAPAAPNLIIEDGTTPVDCDINLSELTESYYSMNVTGSFNLPSDLIGRYYLVNVDTSLQLDAFQGPSIYTIGMADSTTVNYALSVPEGTYYLFVLVDANYTGEFGDAGDYVAIYGSTYPEHPQSANLAVGTDPVDLAPLDVILLTEPANFVVNNS